MMTDRINATRALPASLFAGWHWLGLALELDLR